MRRWLTLLGLRSERGMALVMALGVMTVLGTASATAIYYSTSSARTSNYSRSKSGSFSLAEAGINNAMAVLSNPSNNSLDPDALCPSGQQSPCSQTSTYTNGTVTWSGILDRANAVWSLTSKGSSKNTSVASGNVTQTLTAKVSVTPTYTQPLNNPSWDYIMSTATGGTCDMTLANAPNTGNPLTVAARLYVFGNLCLGTSAGGTASITGGPLMVKGKVNINEGNSKIGSSGSPVNEVHVGQGCKYLSNTLHNPCQQGAGSSGKDNLWATVIDSTVPNLTAPTADFAGWYENAIPGPSQNCTTTSGTVPTFDTNYPIRDNSVATPFDLTPASSYECRVGPSASPSGILKWDSATNTLTVKGTIFIDGSAKITNGALNQYNGQATLYLSGTFLMNNSSKLCGGVSGSNCDFAAWNPNTELLTIVAGGSGGQVPAGCSVHIVGGQFQGAIFGTNKVRLEGATQVDGPLVGSEVELGYNVSSGSSTGYGFPLITTVPVGMPSNPAVYAQPNPPQMFSG